MKIVNKIITTLLSLCLMLLIMAICLLSSLPAFFSPSTYLSALEEANAYKSIQENIQNSLDDIMLFNNIDRQAMREFMTVEEVKEVVVGDVYALLSWLNGTGKNVAPLDVSIYEARFDERINTFFLENQYYLDDDAKQDVELMKKNAMQVIQGNLRMLNYDQLTSMDSLQKVTSLIGMMNIKLVVCGLAAIAIVIVGILTLISPRSRRRNRRKKYELGLLWSAYGIVAGGLMIFIIFFSGVQSKFYNHIAINVGYLRESLSILIGNALQNISIFGLVAALIGFILMIPYWAKLYKKCMA